jgi:thiol:disulfide interchange protein
MKRSILLALSALLVAFSLNGQIKNPVRWSTSWTKIGAQEFELVFTATIDPGWYVYSQFLEENGPIPTSFHFNAGAHFQLLGKAREEGRRKEGYDEIFGMNVVKFSGTVNFRQRVKLLNPAVPIAGYLEYMTCDNEQCLPPTEEEFNFDLSTAGSDRADAGKTPAVPVAPADVQPAADAPLLATPEVSSGAGGLLDPVKWAASIRELSKGVYELTWTADLQPGWNIYSQFTADNGPIPTTFSFDDGSHFKGIGQVQERGKLKEARDPLFGGILVKKFTQGPVVFSRKVEVSDPAVAITGTLTYMACDQEKCLPPNEVDFRFVPAALQAACGPEAAAGTTATPAPGTGQSAIEILYGGMPKPSLAGPVADCSTGEASISANTGLGNIFLLGFLGGLLALLTPCVFPMIPLTVSFFTKGNGQSKGISQAGLYGFFILAVYLILSIPFHLMDSINPDILNDISTNVWLNIAFFVIFLVFAFSFFGYYELTLPNSWVNRTSQAEGIGGALGTFFMALTLALVSFSCTGPILGSLLAGALTSDGGAWQLSAGMGGFGLALALPFALFAAFPGMMKRLPKSGGWLNTVKVVLGFLELALALKFLSNADLVKHWGILTIEPFLILWILTFLGLALYLFGVIRFPHDSPGKRPPVQIILGLASLAFTGYLGTGFAYDKQAGSYRSLTLLSGLAPPVCYSWFQPCNCPQNLSCFKDLQEGLAYARQLKKPVMLDFTGHACVNCRKMEEHVWPRPAVYQRLKNDYVVISLYVDDKRELPTSQQLEVPKINGGTRKLRTVGQKWSYFQTEYFQTNSQPFYVLLSPDGQLLNTPVGYTPDVKDYVDFLQCGKDAFSRLASTE